MTQWVNVISPIMGVWNETKLLKFYYAAFMLSEKLCIFLYYESKKKNHSNVKLTFQIAKFLLQIAYMLHFENHPLNSKLF